MFFSLVIGVAASSHADAQTTFGTAHGRVINVVGLPVPNAVIIFESRFEF